MDNETFERHHRKYESVAILDVRLVNSIEGSVWCASGHADNFPPICGAQTWGPLHKTCAMRLRCVCVRSLSQIR